MTSSAYGSNEDDKAVPAQVGAGHDGQRHKKENANQQPIHIQPPGTIPIDVGKDLLSQRPPNVDYEEDNKKETADENPGGAVPAEERGPARHPQIISISICISMGRRLEERE